MCVSFNVQKRKNLIFFLKNDYNKEIVSSLVKTKCHLKTKRNNMCEIVGGGEVRADFNWNENSSI